MKQEFLERGRWLNFQGFFVLEKENQNSLSFHRLSKSYSLY